MERKPPQDTESRHADKYIVRFPDGMRDQLKKLAKANGRTLNAEIISRLQQTLSGSLPPSAAPVTADLAEGVGADPVQVGEALAQFEQDFQNLKKAITARIELTMPRPRGYLESEGAAQEATAAPPDPDRPAEA